MNVRSLVVIVVGVGFGTSALAQDRRVPIPQLFPSRADVVVRAGGLQSLELPIEVVQKCRPDLSDLRVWNSDEVAYLVDSSGPSSWTLADKATAKIGALSLDRKAPLCGAAPDTGAKTHCQSFDVTTAARGEGWELVFDTTRDRFVERVALKVAGKVHAESIYRLPSGPTERVRISLPALTDGALSLALAGDGEPVSPGVHLERGRSVRGHELVDAPLTVVARWHDLAGSHVLLERPGGVLPSALRFEVKSAVPTFDRPVTVYDFNGYDVRRLVGEGRLSRVSMSAAGSRVAIEQLDVPLGVPRARKLEVVIDDGDSAPLEPTVFAVLRRPILIFDAGPGTLTLFFGGGRAEAPRYDLQGLLPNDGEHSEGVRAEIAARLRQREGLQVATLGPITANPAFDPTPALASVMHGGSIIDDSIYSHARPLTLVPSPDGLSRYVLAAADVATARPDLADVRVVDEQDHQWPYLVDREADALVVELGKPMRTSSNGVSRYTMTLPSSPLSFNALTLAISEPFFDRAARIVVHDEAGRETATGTRLQRTLGTRAVEPITLQLAEGRTSSVTLEVTDGGDAPLSISIAHVHTPTAALLLAARPGTYTLLVGNPDDTQPTYELQALDSLLHQLDAAPAHAGPLTDNPHYSRSARMKSGGGRDRLLVWLMLGLAVLVLGGLTLRMARTPPADDPPSA